MAIPGHFSAAINTGAYGVADGHGGFISGTAIIIDDSIPPLFGYQPYRKGKPGNEGYVPYGTGAPGADPIFANNQVFDQAAFPALLQGLWEVSGRETCALPRSSASVSRHGRTSGSASPPPEK
jgi:hypothetical protein